jgi:hypothetical protein
VQFTNLLEQRLEWRIVDRHEPRVLGAPAVSTSLDEQASESRQARSFLSQPAVANVAAGRRR